MKKRTLSLILAFVMVLAMIPAAYAAESALPDGASLEAVEAVTEGTVYAYSPSVTYDPITSMMNIFIVYADTPITSRDAALDKLTAMGLIDLCEAEKAAAFVMVPANGESYTAADYDVAYSLLTKLNQRGGIMPYGQVIPKKAYLLGEGKGADFIVNYMTNDVMSGSIAAHVLIGADSVPAEKNYAVPAYLINCSDNVVDFYKDINDTDTVTNTDDTAKGLKVYYNSQYVMDGGYTTKRVIVDSVSGNNFTPTITNSAWNVLCKRVWRDPLNSNLFDGSNLPILDRPIADEMNMTFTEVTNDDPELTRNGRWYEWVPNEVFETMANGTGETYPLIVVYHGNGDHEIYEAESNGWVTLAGGIRAIVVAPRDNYEPGMPPESAANRYGPENAAFIRDVICEKYPVDMSRIYAVGFSIGGFTVAETTAADPSLFAAAAAEAYPADGFMQIFPYNEYGGDEDAEKYDLPFVYHAGTSDNGNSMPHPTDSTKPRVLSAQLFFNQILTFNNMTDQLIDLVDFNYDLYPGEGDMRRDWHTGEVTGGYDFWDGTAAQYITQKLDFDAYPYYGYDFLAIPNTSRSTAATQEGIEYTKNIWYNDSGMPMLQHMVMGDMGHNHYTRYAQIIWDDMFSHYYRNPENGALTYIENSGFNITAAETYTVTIPAGSIESGDITAKITTADGKPAFTDESGIATAAVADGYATITVDASKISGISFNGTSDLYINGTWIGKYTIPEITVDNELFGSVFTNGKSTLKAFYDEKVDYAEDSKAVITLDLAGLDNSLIDSSNARVILDEGDGYFPEEYTFLATSIGAFTNGSAEYALKQGDLEMDVQGYITADENSGREWSCLGGDGHGNYYYNLTVDGITYNGLPVGSQTFRLHIYVYGYDYTSDANSLYTAEGTKITAVKSETGSGKAQGSDVIWTHDDTPVLCDWIQDDIFVTWPTGSDKSNLTAKDVTITLKSAYGDTKVLEADKDYTVFASAGETQIAMSYINWSFLPVYTTMTVTVDGESETMPIGSVYVYEAQQGGGGTTVDGTVTVYSFYGLKDVSPIASYVTYTLSAEVDGAVKYYAENADGSGILVDDAAQAKSFDGNGEADCNVQVIENSIYITTRRNAVEDKTVNGNTITFTKTYTRGGMLNPSQTDTDLLEALPGYVIPYGTTNWITNEKWAWQQGVNEGWTTFHFVNEGNRASYSVERGSVTQLALQTDVPDVKYKLVGRPTSADTSVTEDGLLTIGFDESGFVGVCAYIEGDPYAKATVTFSLKDPINCITADSAALKAGEAESIDIAITYTGVPASSIRARIETELPILEFDSELEYEYNPEIKTFVVYTSDSFPSGTIIGTVKLDTGAAQVGEYPVGLTVIDATDGDAKKAEITGVSGIVIITADALKGDLNRDGEVNNADLVMLARYLVELETFDAEQLIIGDYNSDGTIDNRDLVLLARYLVGLEGIDDPGSLN